MTNAYINNGKKARGGKISKDDAIVKALKMGVDFNKDFHAQSFGGELTELAKETGYRKSKSSSGSTGRAFFEHLERRYDKNPSSYDDMAKQMARGGKMQGYNAQLDESLGMRRGAKRTKQQSDKDRRDESKAMSKSMDRRAYAGVRGMDKGRRKMAVGGKTTMAGDTDFPSELLNYAKGGKVEEKYEKFKHELITRIQEDIGKSKERADAHKQEGNKEALAFEKGHQNALTTTLFDINELDYNFYNYAKGGNIPNLKVTDIKYNETRRGISYIAKTNVKGVEIVNDGMGGATFLEGSWKDIKPYNNLDESDLEELINVYEKVYAKGGKMKKPMIRYSGRR